MFHKFKPGRKCNRFANDLQQLLTALAIADGRKRVILKIDF